MKKSLPKWLKTNSLEESKENINILPKRTLRSNYSFDSISAAAKTEIIKPIDYPPIVYTGKIHYHTEMIDIAFSCDKLLTWLNEHPDYKVPIAFDMEWPFSFKTGPGKSAVIQMCADVNECYVFHLTNLKKLPVALLNLLVHPKIVSHGVNIKNDFRKLQRDYPEVNSEKMIERCLDLAVWSNDVLDTSGRKSLHRLVAEVCQLKIDKSNSVRMSQWHVIPLNDDQRLYAAIDVYISQVIYHELKKRKQEKDEKIAEFVKNYGEEALNVVNSLK